MAITTSLKGRGGTKPGAFHNDEVIRWDDKLILGLTEAAVKHGIKAATLAVEQEAQRLVGGTGDQSSPPGQPPHLVTGEFAGSISHEFEDEGLTGIVGTNDPVGRWLEFGTSKMAARPWLRPALEGVISRAEQFFNSKF